MRDLLVAIEGMFESPLYNGDDDRDDMMVALWWKHAFLSEEWMAGVSRYFRVETTYENGVQSSVRVTGALESVVGDEDGIRVEMVEED